MLSVKAVFPNLLFPVNQFMKVRVIPSWLSIIFSSDVSLKLLNIHRLLVRQWMLNRRIPAKFL